MTKSTATIVHKIWVKQGKTSKEVLKTTNEEEAKDRARYELTAGNWTRHTMHVETLEKE